MATERDARRAAAAQPAPAADVEAASEEVQTGVTLVYTGDYAGAAGFRVDLGKADGLSRDYTFDSSNKFTAQNVDPADARKIREIANAPTFKFRITGLD